MLAQRGCAQKMLADFPALVKLLYRLLRDPRVSRMDKSILVAILLYILNPFDLLPDAVPVLGQVDDAYLLALGLLRLLSRTETDVLERHWEGESDIRELLDQIVQVSSFLIPRKIRELLLGKIHEYERAVSVRR